jgi:hypothetical protein
VNAPPCPKKKAEVKFATHANQIELKGMVTVGLFPIVKIM